GTLAASTTYVAAINNLRQIVGQSVIKDRPITMRSGPSYHAFIWDHATITDLNTQVMNPGRFEITSANAVNARGHILADAGDPLHTFVLLIPTGGPLVATNASRKPTAETVTRAQVQPLLTEAISRWQKSGAEIPMLQGIDVRIADLGG